MDYHKSFREIWDQSSFDFPALDKTYSRKKKIQKEQVLDQFFTELRQGLNRDVFESNDQDLFRMMESFFRNGLDYTHLQLKVILSDDMVKATKEFIYKARQFDKTIPLDDIFQACRNVWIMNGYQYLMGATVRLTPSIFAYSMLYPYTDNFVDDPLVSDREKEDFSLRFENRLKGKKELAQNQNEQKIYELVEMIEQEWDRLKYPKVFESLLAIHRTQTQSISLLSSKLPSDEIFRLCVDKGGTSVIADGYLIFGEITQAQEKFLYNYGAYLQLLDDMQDVQEDFKDGINTYFAFAAANEQLDEYLCRTFHLGFRIMEEVNSIQSGIVAEDFKSLMKKSIDLFLIEAVISNNKFFSRRFVRKFEVYSPFRYSFIRKRSSTLSPYQKLLFKNIEEYTLSSIQKEKDGKLKFTA